MFWGFLATSHAPVTAYDFLSNKLYFCLGLLSNLADLLRPVDARLIILGTLIYFFPHYMASHWASWMLVDQNELYLNLMFFDLPRKLYV